MWKIILLLLLINSRCARTTPVNCSSFDRATALIGPLMDLYNPITGMWKDTIWWTSANHLAALADYTAKVPSEFPKYKWVMENTFSKCQEFSMIHNHNDMATLEKLRSVSPPPAVPKGFVNEYYDDDGWWALVWIKIFDITTEPRYLDAARYIFEHMTTGWDETLCGGGVPWTLYTNYKNAISNELFFQVSAALANRIPQNATYLEWAEREWNWFENSKMWNERGTINDGLDNECNNNNEVVWSYNQGVILGGLVELYKKKQDPHLLSRAYHIADSAISELSRDSVLHDICEPDCDNWASFKGVFIRNLDMLNEITPEHNYTFFLQTNADSLWEKNRNEHNQVGTVWSGPVHRPDEVTQSAGLACLNAVINCIN